MPVAAFVFARGPAVQTALDELERRWETGIWETIDLAGFSRKLTLLAICFGPGQTAGEQTSRN